MIQQSNFFALETAPARAGLETRVKQTATLCEAKAVYWCDGPKEEYDWL